MKQVRLAPLGAAAMQQVKPSVAVELSTKGMSRFGEMAVPKNVAEAVEKEEIRSGRCLSSCQ